MRTPADIKRDLVAAHRAQNWARAAELSQERERAKARRPRCSECGAPVARGALRCLMHDKWHRFHGRALEAAP